MGLYTFVGERTFREIGQRFKHGIGNGYRLHPEMD
jgi:hypothetical protein